MKRKTLFLAVIVATLFSACKQKPNIEYKFQDKPKVVDCPGIDSDLIHEALYSFELDIGNAFNFRNVFNPKMDIFYSQGYANFIYRGAAGTVDYKGIASPHTVAVFRELQKIEGLWLIDNERSHLNYDHEYVECLLSNIQSDDIRQTIASLREINSMTPKMIAEPLRKNIQAAYEDDMYFAMYVALDTFYQYLFDVDLSEVQDTATPNE